MSVNLKDDFLSSFQNRIIQGRKLLMSGNHRWGDRLLLELYFDIEKTEWLDIQKKHQLTLIISNSWWMYLNSLLKRKDQEKIDVIKYIDAYKRFFSFLSKLDDFYLFNNFSTNLLKSFIKMEGLSLPGITKFITSFSYKVKDREEYLKLIELQILLMFLRNSVFPSELFHLSTENLGRTVFKLEPSKRALFLYIFLENINLKYQLVEDSNEFVNTMNLILVNRLPGYLKNEFGGLNRVSINERNFPTILAELEELIYYLNNIGEESWITIIIRSIYTKVQEYQSFADAMSYMRKFIDFSISRNRFEIAFEVYDFLEDIFMYQTDLGYDNVLIEIWVEACKKFVEMKEKKYLLQSLEKLNNHLKIPQTKAQIFHYFYTCNYLWKFKSGFFSLDQRDFWRMMFYRALFEEKDFNLAQKIIPYLEKNIKPLLTDLNSLYNESEALMGQIYSFDEEFDKSQLPEQSFIIKQMIIRVNSEGVLSYRMISLENKIVKGKLTDEFWNDAQVFDIYNELFSGQKEKTPYFDLLDLGRILYIFLPRLFRTFFKQIKIASLTQIPQIYFILDNMTIPFELIHDGTNFFLLKYSNAYKIGEASLSGVAFDETFQEELLTAPSKDVYNVLIIDAINAMGPFKWIEEQKNKELIYQFSGGANELNYITNFFNNREEVNQINMLSGSNSTRENILLNLSQGAYHVIHFVGNIFYSKWSPKDSFFLTNENNIVTFNEIRKSLDQNESHLQPLLFFNTQIYDVDGKKLKNTLRTFGRIVEQFDYDRITGIVSRNYPIFNNETKEIIANFYINLFGKRSQGVALLKARQACMAKKTISMTEQHDGLSLQKIGVDASLAISSYILFGKPWKKL